MHPRAPEHPPLRTLPVDERLSARKAQLGRSSSDPSRGKWTTPNGQTERHAASKAGESLCNVDARITCVQSTLSERKPGLPSTLCYVDTRACASGEDILMLVVGWVSWRTKVEILYFEVVYGDPWNLMELWWQASAKVFWIE